MLYHHYISTLLWICHQVGPRNSGRIGTKWNISAPGQCYYTGQKHEHYKEKQRSSARKQEV